VSKLTSENTVCNNPVGLANECLVIFGLSEKPIRIVIDELPRSSAVEGNNS
jgi:hypothetical protein